MYRTNIGDLASNQMVKTNMGHTLYLFFPLTITKKMTFSVFPVSTWKEYEENIWNGKTEDIDKLGCCGTLNKILMLYSREIPECCSSQYKKGADFRGRHLLCIAIIIIISSNYFPINLAFYGYCCLLRLFWLLIASYQGKNNLYSY